MLITKDTDLNSIDIFPSYDSASPDEYYSFTLASKKDQARKSIFRYSIFQCDDPKCAVEFKGMATLLRLENMECPVCHQKTAGFIKNCTQPEDEDEDEKED